MKILITGLALSRNLGAPAMALSLITEIGKKFPNAIFTMAVSSTDMEQELKWLKYYQDMGFQIEKLVPRSTITSYIINKIPIKKIYQLITGKYKLPAYKNQKDRKYWLDQHKKFISEIKESDLVISMYGISYVGDGVHKVTDGLSDYSPFYYAKKYSVPYTRFIQSYGPFDDYRIKFFAKKELNFLPFIYARGKNSASYCREIVKNKSKVFDVPDLAILLNKADDMWTQQFLKDIDFKEKEYVIISPSAVIYAMPKKVTGSIGEKHIESVVLIVKELLKEGNKILLLPHMYSDKKWECDREICFKILEKLAIKEKQSLQIVVDDIDAMQAKSLIASSKLAIVSRYHALVAAVSTSTPVITIGWNIKYYDLMEYFCIEDMAIDTRDNMPKEILNQVIKKRKFYANKKNLLVYKIMKQRVEEKVLNAVDNLNNWITDATR